MHSGERRSKRLCWRSHREKEYFWKLSVSWEESDLMGKQEAINYCAFNTEAEYISASVCNTQMLWIKSQLEDYQIFESNIPIFCDNTAAICLSKNPILHSRAKHIEIKHHFIRHYVQKGILNLTFIDTDHQWADIFTKPLAEDRFLFILKHLKMDYCPE